MWCVARTTSKGEFQAAEELRAQGLNVFLPYTREKVRVRLPTRGRALFKVQTLDIVRWPRYLFVSLEAGQRAVGRYVEGLIHFGEDVARVRDEDVAHLRKGCDATGRIVHQSYLYAAGDILRFLAPSPFVGRRGEVVRLDETSVLLSVGGHFVSSPYAEVA